MLEHLALTDQHKMNPLSLSLPPPFCSPSTGMYCLVSHPAAQTMLYSSQISVEGKGQVVPGYSLLFPYISQTGDHRHTNKKAVGVIHATVLYDIVLWKDGISIQEIFLKTEIYFPVQKASIWVTT